MVDWDIHEGGQSFVRSHGRLWNVIRRRNFEASVSRVAGLVRFGEGWYESERTGAHSWRWMRNDATALLPSFRGSGIASLRIHVSIHLLPAPPTISVRWNGQVIERFVATTEDVERSWTLTSRTGAANELRIVTSTTVVPASGGGSEDTRELGVRLDRLSWMPVQ